MVCLSLKPLRVNDEPHYFALLYIFACYLFPLFLSLVSRRTTILVYGFLSITILILFLSASFDKEYFGFAFFDVWFDIRNNGLFSRLVTANSRTQGLVLIYLAALESRLFLLIHYSAFVIFSGFLFCTITRKALVHIGRGTVASLALGAGIILLLMVNFVGFLTLYLDLLDMALENTCDYAAIIIAHTMITLISAILIGAYAYEHWHTSRHKYNAV